MQKTETKTQMYTYRYPRPAVTTDCVVFAQSAEELQVLLVERGNEPYKGCWAFPGGFLNMDEEAEDGARRELKEETGLEVGPMKQIGAFAAVHRDPRGRVISIAFVARSPLAGVTGGDDAAQARWFSLSQLPPLAFDHADMLRQALHTLREL